VKKRKIAVAFYFFHCLPYAWSRTIWIWLRVDSEKKKRYCCIFFLIVCPTLYLEQYESGLGQSVKKEKIGVAFYFFTVCPMLDLEKIWIVLRADGEKSNAEEPLYCPHLGHLADFKVFLASVLLSARPSNN
jgi:hypothetical protein